MNESRPWLIWPVQFLLAKAELAAIYIGRFSHDTLYLQSPGAGLAAVYIGRRARRDIMSATNPVSRLKYASPVTAITA